MIALHEKTRRISQCSFGGGIRDIADACNKLEKKGMKTFHFEIGEPDFDSPEEAKEACKRPSTRTKHITLRCMASRSSAPQFPNMKLAKVTRWIRIILL